MKTKLLLLTIAMSGIFASNAQALTTAEYKTQKNHIAADYKTNWEKCGVLKGHAKNLCAAEAKGAEKVAKAELEAQYEPSVKNDLGVSVAKAETTYAIAKEKCDALSGNDKNVCVKDAEVAHAKAKQNAKRASAADTSKNKTLTISEVKTAATNAGAGEALYKRVCQACHASGVAGAPKFGDKAAWAPRIKTGIDAMTANAIKGKGAMPPRGGSTASDADIKSAVEYMANAAK
jgi:cytochrome c5